MPQNIAPPNVYSTSRSMGNNKDVNMGFNLTWIFQVDPGSMYLTRLHFCDYFYSKVNEIVFKIFINNQTAEAEADVIGWTGGKGVPTYTDYVIYVKDEAGDDQLWLALHPALETKPEFYDSLLNGVEVFKLNDTDLSGPNPRPSEMNSHTAGTKTSGSGKSVGSANISAMAQGLCRYFSLQEMKQATKNFDESNVIGVGGFGKVYKGVIDNGFKVAIKRSNPQSEQGGKRVPD
ncbi:Receptor-like protein kinase ANXUR1 [Glycine soja]